MKTTINFKMIAKSLTALVIFAFLTLIMYSCGDGNSSNTTDTKEKVVASPVEKESSDSKEIADITEANKDDNNSSSASTATASGKAAALTVKESLEKAKKDANSVFLVITDSAKARLDKALEMAGKANKIEKKSVVIQMDRGDKSNKELVKEYGVAGAPLPLMLVISPKGVMAGGYLFTEATAEKLTKLIPTLKQDDVLSALSKKKSVFVVASKKTFTDKNKVIENCQAAVTQMGNKAELVQVDMDDSKEKPFLELLKINTATTSTATVVLNTKGQINGTFYELKDVASLVTLANKVASGCCAGGSGKGCGK